MRNFFYRMLAKFDAIVSVSYFESAVLGVVFVCALVAGWFLGDVIF